MDVSLTSYSHEGCPLCSLTKNKAKKETITILDNLIEMSTTITIAAERFPCIGEKILALCNKQHLPKIKTLYMERGRECYYPNCDNLLRLCFLSMIKEKSDKLPVTKEEADIFDESYTVNTKTSKWLGWRAITSYVLLAGSSGALNFLGFAQIVNSPAAANGTAADSNGTASNSNSVNQIFTTTLICSTVIALGIMTNLAGLWWTGRNPDNSSNKANLQQNRIHLLQREYLDLALELINLYYNRNDRLLAEAMSKEINTELVGKFLNEKAHDEDASKLVGLVDLQAIIEFIKSEGRLLPRNVALRMHIACAEKGYFI